MKWLHILGANIPHHNRTLLTFFAEQIAPTQPEKPRFWVVGEAELAVEFPALAIRTFPSKAALAKAVIAKNWQDPTACFFFHGQYNAPLWLAILFGVLPAERCAWHIWGADLYESSQSLAFKLFYPLRRLAQKRLKTVFGTQGDLDFFAQLNPQAVRKVLYFPTKMPMEFSPHPSPPPQAEEGTFQVLLGNSGDRSNLHLDGLSLIAQRLGKVAMKIPMGYPANNAHYIKEVAQLGTALFGEQVEIWREPQPFANYLANLTACDCGVFPFERQQGIGTLCLLIALNIPFAISRKNPFARDLEMQNVPFLYLEQLSREAVERTKQQLHALDKSQIAFFPLHYRQLWLERLGELCT